MIFTALNRRNALKIEGERSSVLDLARGRLTLVSGFFILIYVIFAVRAFDLSVIQARTFHSESTNLAQLNANINIQAAPEKPQIRRADMFDRNGVLVATTLKTVSLYADSYLIADPKTAAKKLVKIYPDLKYGEVLQKLQSEKRFVWIKRNVSPDQHYKTLEIGEPGLEFEEEFKRFYPQGELVSHLIGYGNVDSQGLSGVERSFNKILNKGQDIQLTIDVRLQHALRRELKKAMDDFQGIAAAGAIMDVTNGEILAGVSLPDFNPHNPGEADKNNTFNRLTLGAYELGSVFKIFSTAGFFEQNNVPMGTTFDARTPIKIGKFTINDYHAENRILTVPEIFMHSSNIGTALMAQAIGTDNLRKFYTDLGLLTPLDFEVREVAHPLVPNPWREINTLTASYGHGITTTPLQLIAGVSSIVNGGYLVKPSLVMQQNSKAPKHIEQHTEQRIISAQTSERMRELLRLVVTEGTGRNADVQGYRIGGKTGTAEKIVNGVYDQKKKISSFIGVFPMDEPRYAIYIMVDEPKGQKRTHGYATGGWVAAPAVARTVSSMASILGIPAAPEQSAENHFGDSIKKFVSFKKGGH